MKFSLILRILRILNLRILGIRLILGPEFLVSFFISMISHHLLTYDENFNSEAHGMNIGLF